MKEAEMYRKARELIIKNGWWNGRNIRVGEDVCLIIALNKVGGILTEKTKLRELVGPLGIIHFNDNNTKNDVLAALEIAEHLATPTPKD